KARGWAGRCAVGWPSRWGGRSSLPASRALARASKCCCRRPKPDGPHPLAAKLARLALLALTQFAQQLLERHAAKPQPLQRIQNVRQGFEGAGGKILSLRCIVQEHDGTTPETAPD